MSQNPLNLALRFILELAGLFAIGYWGWVQFDGALRIPLMIGLPILFAAIWGIFRVPADASANGKAPIAVPGWLRLLIELAFFTFGTWCLFNAGVIQSGWIFGTVTLIHYVISYDRLSWLLKH